MSEGLQSYVTEVGALPMPAAAAWDSICRTNPAFASGFYSRSFAEAASKARSDVFVCVLERRGEPVAFLPFQFRSCIARNLRSAERVGGHLNDYFGLVALSGVRIEPKQLLRLAGLSQFVFSHLDESQEALGLSGDEGESTGTRYDISAGPIAFWDELRRRDKDFAADTMRKVRRIERDLGPLRFASQVRDGGAELDRLIAVKRAQYAQSKYDDPLAPAWTRRLLHRLALLDDPLCTGVLSTLHAGDTWVATHFGLRCRDTLHIWFPGYNRDAGRYSPGRLLLKALIDASPLSGIQILDDGESNAAQQQKRQMGNATHRYSRGTWRTTGTLAFWARVDSSMQWRWEWLLNKVTKGVSS